MEVKHIFGFINYVEIDNDGDAEINLHGGEYCILEKADTIAIAKAQGITAEDLADE